jgi:4-hydroxy-3-methylbut-2-enyl diphosphate reductase
VTYDLVVFAALGWERRAVTDALSDVTPWPGGQAWRGRLGDGASCLVFQTGMGPTRAARAAASAPPARAFLAAGCGGGLAPWLRAGDVVVATAVVDATDGTRREADCEAVAAWAARRGLRVHAGPLVASATVLASAEAKRAAAKDGALIVDMESAPLAAAAGSRAIPFAVVRVVVDGADEVVPLSPVVVDEQGELRPARVAVHLAMRPWLWPATARLARQSRVAEKRLRALLATILGEGGMAAVAAVPMGTALEA